MERNKSLGGRMKEYERASYVKLVRRQRIAIFIRRDAGDWWCKF